ncbi:hypothetical protein D9611_003195 [Ephemerocybe angulata]|uniref:Uncharacterized protein n=1 Tax=Ephemerocybe angulata TaxID=980116 RepID=A0A8H5FHL8_9AGAR|nr:hypothetical protein D9611_003195 [Tulosesus angulatus]
MYADPSNTNGIAPARPSGSQYGSSHSQKRRATMPEEPTFNPNVPPLGDPNSWYYPSQGCDSDEDDACGPPLQSGNWGRKTTKGSRWMRRGKMTAWGPGMDEWEAEERARKRIKLMLPQTSRSPSPPCIAHLERSPSPPLVSPYPPPQSVHLSYSSFVMDKSVTHTFRSRLLDELEQATNGLIEGEATLTRALGRLWQVMSEDPDEKNKALIVPKREEDDEADLDDPRQRRVARAPDLTPPTHKIFLLPHPNGAPPGFDPDPTHFKERQMETLEKSLSALRELQDDGREYVERLQEIREGLGDVKAQRNIIWDVVRERAIKELQDAAFATAGVVQ